MVEVKYERQKRDIPKENQRNYKEKGLGGGGGGGLNQCKGKHVRETVISQARTWGHLSYLTRTSTKYFRGQK